MERRVLQIAILLAGVVPVVGGGAGAVLGEAAFGPWAGAAEDSHMRYLSGLLLAIGLIFWACVPTIERRGGVVRVLTLLVVVGGLARLAGMVFGAGDPGPTMRWTPVMELIVTPLLCLWQMRVARAAGADQPSPSPISPAAAPSRSAGPGPTPGPRRRPGPRPTSR